MTLMTAGCSLKNFAGQILVIEDNPGDARLVSLMLGEVGVGQAKISIATRVAEALINLPAAPEGCVLMDLGLPDARELDGLEAIVSAAPGLAVIVLTGSSDDALVAKALERGAQDYLVKGEYESDDLGRAIRYAVERKRAEAELAHQASFDSLTGLPNRSLLEERLGAALSFGRREGRLTGLMFIDLDNFKTINDSLGHEVGDRVLITFAQRVNAVLRPGDTLARFGGDEFILLIPDLPDSQAGERVAERVNAVLRAPFDKEVGAELGGWRLAASVGLAMASEEDTVSSLIRNADAAMYLAKESGKGRHMVFTEELRTRVLARMEMESEVRRAAIEGQLALHFQPIIRPGCEHVAGLEARVRWNHPRLGRLLPGEFLPLVREMGLSGTVSKWIIQKVCEMMSSREITSTRRVQLVVNVSADQLAKDGFVSECQTALETYQVKGEAFCLVITDLSTAKGGEQIWNNAQALKALGMKICLGGFGSGPTPIHELRRGIADLVKIEHSLIADLGVAPEEDLIVKTLIDLAHMLGVKVIGEGVETEIQKTKLIEMGCDWLQGFLVGREDLIADFGDCLGEVGCDC